MRLRPDGSLAAGEPPPARRAGGALRACWRPHSSRPGRASAPGRRARLHSGTRRSPRSPRGTRPAGRARGAGRLSARVRIWCLRHAESEANAGTPGAGDDSRLTERGRRQARAAAQALAAEPVARIYASPALRARQTAALLATTPGPPVTVLPELVEVACTADDLRAWVVEQDLGRRAADGESGHQVVARVGAALRRIARAHPGETVVVVGHVASLTVALGRLCRLGARVWGTPLPHAQPFRIERDGHGWRCPAWPAAAPSGTP